MMRIVPEMPIAAIVNIEGNHCSAGVFVIRALHDRCAIDLVATHRVRLKGGFADSESRFLAINKFSCSPAPRLIAARQNRFFERIASADSRGDFSSKRCAPLAIKEPRAPTCASDDTTSTMLAKDRAAFRCRVWISADRSPTADWPCRRTTSSPDRRTSRSTPASPWPAPPCRDWRQ
jgi:hypothetical protein